MKITIKEKDLLKRKNDHETTKKDYPLVPFTNSGMLIDELAYSAKQWTSDDLQDNNFEYEPNEPYNFDFESDLFNQTKTKKDLYSLMASIGLSEYKTIDWIKTKKLQAGAYIALNYPDIWIELVETYTEAVKDQNTKDITISKEYRDELAEAVTSFHDDLYHEWLHGGCERDNNGVIEEIRKYYGAESIDYDKENAGEITFTYEHGNHIDTDEKISKAWLLDQIFSASETRRYKDNQESEKRRAERERLAIYKKEQATKAEADRKAKLLAMKLI